MTLLAIGTVLAAARPQAGQAPFTAEVEAFVEIFVRFGGDKLDDWIGESRLLPPEVTQRAFRVREGLEMELVAAEPLIRQPIDLHFDERGRLWVAQYLQYPFPAGLKVTRYDQYLRATFDGVPRPPPLGVLGADRVTILEDSNGDGHFDRARDFATGLNIMTSVLVGGGGVWVMQPPYLLFYPDGDRDGVPDHDPEVHLSGFGLEDTHSLANSLSWGPDGWIYGVHGSTSSGDVRGMRFLGQAVWRYHPGSERFELFSEGGGNPWTLDFDSRGRAFSGTNWGQTRGLHWVQGGRYVKNWPKHGPFTRPFSFGFFPHMEHEGYAPRFSMTLVLYEGGALPGLEGQMISGMALTNRVQASRLLAQGSTFRTIDTEPLVLTEDRSFRPVDTKVGPDGAVYFADWADIRMDHVDPRDTWRKDTGRIWRLKAAGASAPKPFDLAIESHEKLIELLQHPNQWFRRQARRLLGQRADPSTWPILSQMVEEDNGPAALEALWALHGSGGFDVALAKRVLEHQDAGVRVWTIRLLGDAFEERSPHAVAEGRYGARLEPPAVAADPKRQERPAPRPSPISSEGRPGETGVKELVIRPESRFSRLPVQLQTALVRRARLESDVEVRSQLASTCRRLPPADCLPILRELILREEDTQDPHIPLLLWWAIQEQATTDREAVLALLEDPVLWRSPLFVQKISGRLARRWAAERGDRLAYARNDPEADWLDLARYPRQRHPEGKGDYGDWSTNYTPGVNDSNLSAAARLLELAPTAETQQEVLAGLDQGLQDGEGSFSFPPSLAQQIRRLWTDSSPSLPLIRLAARLGLDVAEPLAEAARSAAVAVDEAGVLRRGEIAYLEYCSTCHQVDGRGLERLGSPLVNSEWVLGSQERLARIVLHGKQGEFLMPAHPGLEDEELAAVLTYIRAAWGHRSGPVAPEAIRRIRRETAGRETHWTDEELRLLP